MKEKAESSLSLKLQLKDLYSQFPSLEQPLVNKTLVKNKYYYNLGSRICEPYRYCMNLKVLG